MINRKMRRATLWCNNTEPTSLVSVSFFLFSDPCVGPLTGAWWPGSPGTNTLLLALTIGVFTWNKKAIRFSSSSSSLTCYIFNLSKVHINLQMWPNKVWRTCWEYISVLDWRRVTLETVVSMERDKLVWTSRVKQTCLSVVLISCTDGKEEHGR